MIEAIDAACNMLDIDGFSDQPVAGVEEQNDENLLLEILHPVDEELSFIFGGLDLG